MHNAQRTYTIVSCLPFCVSKHAHKMTLRRIQVHCAFCNGSILFQTFKVSNPALIFVETFLFINCVFYYRLTQGVIKVCRQNAIWDRFVTWHYPHGQYPCLSPTQRSKGTSRPKVKVSLAVWLVAFKSYFTLSGQFEFLLRFIPKSACCRGEFQEPDWRISDSW